MARKHSLHVGQVASWNGLTVVLVRYESGGYWVKPACAQEVHVRTEDLRPSRMTLAKPGDRLYWGSTDDGR
jgi:hypothetical protein